MYKRIHSLSGTDIYNNTLLVETTVVDPRHKVAVLQHAMKEEVKISVLLELKQYRADRGRVKCGQPWTVPFTIDLDVEVDVEILGHTPFQHYDYFWFWFE